MRLEHINEQAKSKSKTDAAARAKAAGDLGLSCVGFPSLLIPFTTFSTHTISYLMQQCIVRHDTLSTFHEYC